VRLENTIDSLGELGTDHENLEVIVHDIRREFGLELALLKRDVEGLKKWKEELKRDRAEHARRAWAFGPNVAGALVNVFLSALVAYLASLKRLLPDRIAGPAPHDRRPHPHPPSRDQPVEHIRIGGGERFYRRG
jgi:hypothetical protein